MNENGSLREEKSNRRLIIIAVVIITSSIGLYLWTNWGSPVEYERYDRFGISFDYPEGMEFSELNLVAVFTSQNVVDFNRILSLLETYVIPAVVP